MRIHKYIIHTHHTIPREHAPPGARRPQAGRASEYRNSTYVCYAAVGRGRSSVYEAWIMGNEYKVKLDGRKGWDRRTHTNSVLASSTEGCKLVLVLSFMAVV
jgi:hypothetical protein